MWEEAPAYTLRGEHHVVIGFDDEWDRSRRRPAQGANELDSNHGVPNLKHQALDSLEGASTKDELLRSQLVGLSDTAYAGSSVQVIG